MSWSEITQPFNTKENLKVRMMPVWCKRHSMPDGDRGEALVKFRMLPGTGRRVKNLVCVDGNGWLSEGNRDDCCRGLEYKLGEYGRTGIGKRDWGIGCDVRVGGYFGELTPRTAPLVLIQENVSDGVAREGGEVPDGLHSGVRLLGFPEGGRPRPSAQLRPIHGHGVPARRLHKG